MFSPFIDPELLALNETGITIVHRGGTFQVLTTDHPEADSPYVLRSRKGIHYVLLRNRPKPHLMFGVPEWQPRARVLPGWFSDQHGTLQSLG
jgi:hypothetical protein